LKPISQSFNTDLLRLDFQLRIMRSHYQESKGESILWMTCKSIENPFTFLLSFHWYDFFRCGGIKYPSSSVVWLTPKNMIQ